MVIFNSYVKLPEGMDLYGHVMAIGAVQHGQDFLRNHLWHFEGQFLVVDHGRPMSICLHTVLDVLPRWYLIISHQYIYICIYNYLYMYIFVWIWTLHICSLWFLYVFSNPLFLLLATDKLSIIWSSDLSPATSAPRNPCDFVFVNTTLTPTQSRNLETAAWLRWLKPPGGVKTC